MATMALEVLNIPYHSAISSLLGFVDRSIHTIVLLVLVIIMVSHYFNHVISFAVPSYRFDHCGCSYYQFLSISLISCLQIVEFLYTNPLHTLCLKPEVLHCSTVPVCRKLSTGNEFQAQSQNYPSPQKALVPPSLCHRPPHHCTTKEANHKHPYHSHSIHVHKYFNYGASYLTNNSL